MKSIKLRTLCLVAALSTSMLAGESHRKIPIHGEWDQWNPDLFRTDAELSAHRSYTIENSTTNTITVLQVEIEWDAILGDYGRTPRGYFPVLPGNVVLFGAPSHLQGEVYSLDLNLRGYDGDKIKGITLREAGPELITDPLP